jgi:GNAT superfamily N-acetyltransferase
MSNPSELFRVEILGNRVHLKIREFELSDLNSIYNLIIETIEKSYTGVYPREAIDFFKDYHSKANILHDCQNGFAVVIELHDKIIGTGTLLESNIRRVFIDKSFQRQGLGRLIMERLEAEAREKSLKKVDLSASLTAKPFYDVLGFHTVGPQSLDVANDKQLDYFEMVKEINEG